MNYFQLTRRLWTTHSAHNLSNNAIALYFYLLNIDNILRWRQTFTCGNRKIEFELNLSYRQFSAARAELAAASLISFSSVRGRPECDYSLPDDESADIQTQTFSENNIHHEAIENKPLSSLNAKTVSELRDKLRSNPDGEHPGDINNKTKTKRPNKTTKSLIARQSVSLTAAAIDHELRSSHPVMAEAVRKWLDYKQSRRQNYGSLIGVRTFIARLETLSSGDPIRAERIVEQSVANNWAGIFPLSGEKFSRPNGGRTENHAVGEDKTAFHTDL